MSKHKAPTIEERMMIAEISKTKNKPYHKHRIRTELEGLKRREEVKREFEDYLNNSMEAYR